MLTDARRPRANLLAWSVVVVVSVVVLHASGHGVLAAPPLTHPSGWSAWLAARTPIEAGFAIVRLGAVVAAWELAITTVAGALTRSARAPTLTAAVDRVTAAPLRAVLSASFGIGLATTTITAPTAALAAQAPPAVETMVAFDDTPSPVETMVRDFGTPKTWIVRPGQSFWSMARDVIAEVRQREPTTAEIGAYWLELMDANRDRYRDASVIYPGQRFEVPPPTG